jgi:hypothetical protein
MVEARDVFSYVAIRFGGLGADEARRLVRVSRQSALTEVEIGEKVMIKTRVGAEVFLVVTDVSDLRPTSCTTLKEAIMRFSNCSLIVCAVAIVSASTASARETQLCFTGAGSLELPTKAVRTAHL